MDEAIELFRSIDSEWKEQKGFISAHLGVDRNSDKGFSASVWETLSDLEASESTGWYQENGCLGLGLCSAGQLVSTINKQR